MEPIEQIAIQPITLTEPAVQAVRELIDQSNLQDYGLRVFVSGGGCSGLQYGMSLDNNTRREDTVTEFGGIKVLVDEVSIQYLNGATVDFVDDPTGKGFKINNPNVVSCGCGQSSDDSEGSGCSGCG